MMRRFLCAGNKIKIVAVKNTSYETLVKSMVSEE